SGTPLAKKLGIADGTVLAVLGSPDSFLATLDLPRTVRVRQQVRGRVDVAVCFVTRHPYLERRFPALARAVYPDGRVWTAWPKRRSGVVTDLTENRVREVGLANGLVDNKVCAIDDVWSGLRFVYRVADRRR